MSSHRLTCISFRLLAHQQHYLSLRVDCHATVGLPFCLGKLHILGVIAVIKECLYAVFTSVKEKIFWSFCSHPFMVVKIVCKLPNELCGQNFGSSESTQALKVHNVQKRINMIAYRPIIIKYIYAPVNCHICGCSMSKFTRLLSYLTRY